jgi:Cell Wall Hydrolase
MTSKCITARGMIFVPHNPHLAPYLRTLLVLLVGLLWCCASPAAAQTGEGLTAPDDVSRDRAVSCLATAIAYEAGHEPLSGQEAVAQVILNRVRNPAFPKSVCGVVFQGSARSTGCQFSFTCDGSMRRRMSGAVMLSATAVARSAISGLLQPQVGGATHYHADYVSPYWAPSLVRIAKIGRHIFYRMPVAQDMGSAGFPLRTDEPRIAELDGMTGALTSAPGSVLPRTPPEIPKVFAPWGLSLASLAGR